MRNVLAPQFLIFSNFVWCLAVLKSNVKSVTWVKEPKLVLNVVSAYADRMEEVFDIPFFIHEPWSR